MIYLVLIIGGIALYGWYALAREQWHAARRATRERKW